MLYFHNSGILFLIIQFSKVLPNLFLQVFQVILSHWAKLQNSL